MKGRAIPYSSAELWWLYTRSMMPIGEYHRVFVERFGRDDVLPMHLHSLRKRKGWSTGRTGCFERGAEPHNKGKACAPGTGGRHPNARKTQFKKGGRTGKAAKLYKPIGSERISKDGYRERKVHDGLPFQSRWRAVHRIEWERVNGPVPKGMALKCLDGDRLNVNPSNWEAVPRAILPRLAGGTRKQLVAYDEAPDELKPAILTAAKLAHGARERQRHA